MMEVSVSGFHGYLKRRERPDPDAEIRLEIRAIHHASRGSYILFDDEVSGLLICAFDLDLDLKSPRQTRWPEFDRDLGGKPAGMPV
ncbi:MULTISPECIES: hypothetical protein [Pseudomonas]|uniref:hypothetical protein n=1 Tax=Pseudomonas TaxID=286 RepID=UPI0011123BDD|nr:MULTISPECIES: hypothetical protein [Pseudomonas]